MSKRSAYLFVSALMAFTLLASAVIGEIGGERIWQAFNRGQDVEGILTASGRTGVWAEVIRYSLIHPQGMGYIAGIRGSRIAPNSDASMHGTLKNLGGTDNSFMEVLTDAGWLALALYLLMLFRTIAMGWRFAKKDASAALASDIYVRHSIRCALLLLMFCLAEGMEGSIFTIPLLGAFYCQNILIAMILGASANILVASRPRHASLAK
jgi:hypothetical protein